MFSLHFLRRTTISPDPLIILFLWAQLYKYTRMIILCSKILIIIVIYKIRMKFYFKLYFYDLHIFPFYITFHFYQMCISLLWIWESLNRKNCMLLWYICWDITQTQCIFNLTHFLYNYTFVHFPSCQMITFLLISLLCIWHHSHLLYRIMLLSCLITEAIFRLEKYLRDLFWNRRATWFQWNFGIW